ncbi:hypothetical protein [Sphingomonas profundi]|uniref:hypothetical protein n=1 Tax=Alterirhizorhabdus profundi TaxID=2681549 RepID=UPI0012E84AEA|nr:hypothetical protein [Sphingomonas profundi]
MSAAAGRVAPVAAHALAIAGEAIVGYAAPAGGPLPCTLRLEADGAAIAIERATRFSPEAAAAGVRHGWCGVVLPGLPLAAALADVAQVRCHASGRLLIEVAVPLPQSAPAPPPLTVEQLIARAHERDSCGAIEWILPFAEATLRGRGIAGFLDAAYRTLLGRAVEPELAARWAQQPPPDAMRQALLMILTSPEHASVPGRVMPGPFHPDFAFDLAPLDG